MSQESVEVAQAFYEGYAEGDPARAERCMDPEFEFVPSNSSHITTPTRGPKEFTRRLAELTDQFESYKALPEQLVEAGEDRLVASLVRTVVSHGVRVEDRLGHVIHFRGGRIIRIEAFYAFDDALEAAGLRE
jgi:ketosteroid isomerase-like protein